MSEPDNSWDGCIPAWYKDADTYPPLPEFQVPFYTQLIESEITDPYSKIVAYEYLAKRDRRELDNLIYPNPGNPIKEHEVSDYNDLIDQIPDQDERELAYGELRSRHREGVEGLLSAHGIKAR